MKERLDFIKLFIRKSSSSHQSFSTNGLKIISLNSLIKINIILAWIYKLDLRLRHVNLGCIMPMKGIRVCRPRRRHLGIRIILSWRQLRNSDTEEFSALPLSAKKQSINFPLWKRPPLQSPEPGRGDMHYHWRQKVNTEMGLHKQTLPK